MRIALLTCEKLPNLTLADQLLIPALAKHSVIAEAVVWDNKNINWQRYDYLIFRNTWDYFEKENEFNIWLDNIEKMGIKTLNTIKTIKQNKHKFYLRDLEQKGIKIIPTLFIDKTPDLDLEALIPSHWKKVVIKPAFSGGSYLTELFDISAVTAINKQYIPIAAEKELLVQAFIPEVQTLGETSFIFFNKKFSHCINKKPIEGDFRVQVQFGGKYQLVNPSNILLQKAEEIINTFSEHLLYARVDGIIIENELHLMEIECIEPDLYFNLAENSIDTFVNAVLALIKIK